MSEMTLQQEKIYLPNEELVTLVSSGIPHGLPSLPFPGTQYFVPEWHSKMLLPKWSVRPMSTRAISERSIVRPSKSISSSIENED